MDAKDIKELTETLEALEAKAAELNKHELHSKSPHAGPLRARCLAALESARNHAAWLEAKSKGEPPVPSAPAATPGAKAPAAPKA